METHVGCAQTVVFRWSITCKGLRGSPGRVPQGANSLALAPVQRGPQRPPYWMDALKRRYWPFTHKVGKLAWGCLKMCKMRVFIIGHGSLPPPLCNISGALFSLTAKSEVSFPCGSVATECFRSVGGKDSKGDSAVRLPISHGYVRSFLP